MHQNSRQFCDKSRHKVSPWGALFVLNNTFILSLNNFLSQAPYPTPLTGRKQVPNTNTMYHFQLYVNNIWWIHPSLSSMPKQCSLGWSKKQNNWRMECRKEKITSGDPFNFADEKRKCFWRVQNLMAPLPPKEEVSPSTRTANGKWLCGQLLCLSSSVYWPKRSPKKLQQALHRTAPIKKTNWIHIVLCCQQNQALAHFLRSPEGSPSCVLFHWPLSPLFPALSSPSLSKQDGVWSKFLSAGQLVCCFQISTPR